MKLNRLTLVAVVVFIVVLTSTAAYEHLRNRRISNLQTQSTAAITASLGRMSAVLVELESGPTPHENLAVEVRTSVTQLSLVLLTNELDVGALNADSFSGLCSLVANADRLFPSSQAPSLEGQINELVKKRLNSLQADVRNESSARSLRPGDHHQCALK